MADTWLDAAAVVTAMGSDLADTVDNDALQFWADASRDFVEGRRPDLYAAADVEGDPPVYQPTPSVTAGAALLAYRLYMRRKSPLGVLGVTNDSVSGILREDPDIAKLLGIGRNRRWSFGAPNDTTAVV